MGNILNKPTEAELAGRDITRTAKAEAKVKELQSTLSSININGKLVLASMDEEYQKLRSSAFAYNDCGYPYAFFLPKNAQDISNILKIIGPLNLDMVVSCGKHSAMCFPDNTLVIDMKELDTVEYNLEEKWIDIGGGSKLHKADDKLQGTGYGFVTGTNPDTGVGGLTLTGGWGWLARSKGMAVDNWIEAEVVLSNGEIVIARDDNEHAMLLQAMRGGGGSFGVVTRFRFRLHDVRDCNYSMIVRFTPTMASATQVIQNYRDYMNNAPHHMGGVMVFPCGAPVVPQIVSSVGPLGTSENCTYFDKFEKLEGQWFNLQKNVHRNSDYHSGLQKLLEPFLNRGYSITSASMVAEMSDEMIATILHYTRTEYPNKNTTVFACCMGGKIRDEQVPNSIGHRQSGWWIVIEAVLPNMSPEVVRKHQDWINNVQSSIQKFDKMVQPAHQFFDAVNNNNNQLTNIEDTPIKSFLQKAKAQYDPTNVFHMYK